MRKIKQFLQRILLYLLKKLNMPKQYNNLSWYDLRVIENSFADMVGALPSNRNYYKDANECVFEYTTLTIVSIDGINKAIQNPIEKKIGIDKDMNPIVEGFTEQQTTLITTLIQFYVNNEQGTIWL